MCARPYCNHRLSCEPWQAKVDAMCQSAETMQLAADVLRPAACRDSVLALPRFIQAMHAALPRKPGPYLRPAPGTAGASATSTEVCYSAGIGAAQLAFCKLRPRECLQELWEDDDVHEAGEQVCLASFDSSDARSSRTNQLARQVGLLLADFTLAGVIPSLELSALVSKLNSSCTLLRRQFKHALVQGAGPHGAPLSGDGQCAAHHARAAGGGEEGHADAAGRPCSWPAPQVADWCRAKSCDAPHCTPVRRLTPAACPGGCQIADALAQAATLTGNSISDSNAAGRAAAIAQCMQYVSPCRQPSIRAFVIQARSVLGG